MWVLKEDGNVYQYNVEAKFDEETRTIRQPVIKNQRRVIKSLSNIKQIACGEDHFVALDKKGLVYTMGDDTLGQCGLGNFGRSSGGPFYERRVRNPEAIQGNHSLFWPLLIFGNNRFANDPQNIRRE